MPKPTSPGKNISEYAAAGVDMDVKYRAVEMMTAAVKSTYTPEVLAGIGAFGGLFDAEKILRAMKAPVLVGSTDGVGTKVKLAAGIGRCSSLGEDIVNHCINDILVQGARPLFFLDYFASSKLNPEIIADVVGGMAKACRESGCALIGGETAEMPGVYLPGEFDVAGTIVGAVDREKILPRKDLREGDVLIGIRSSGPHTNGYSLIRKVFETTPLDAVLPELGVPLADALLAPHRSYLPLIKPLIDSGDSPVKALAHLTGGAWIENPIRVFPQGIGAEVKLGSWPVPPLFTLIQQKGEIPPAEMHRVFNMGIGMLVVASAEDAERVRGAIPEETWIVGRLVAGEQAVRLTS
ncbi:MAG: phosphoribosylformylglycinamidine cyclo-ligase [Anaerolineales bacterium]|nr:phosphoribosylformylglycinamidine cyclo-ligase [Anaerolineales bacterium]